MDPIDGFAGYDLSKKLIHFAIDNTTRYVWVFAYKSETPDAYISCLENIFAAGKPKKFLSDRGTGFIAGNFKQCNGMNERTN